MSERGISSHNILEERLRDEPKEHLSGQFWHSPLIFVNNALHARSSKHINGFGTRLAWV